MEEEVKLDRNVIIIILLLLRIRRTTTITLLEDTGEGERMTMLTMEGSRELRNNPGI